MLLFSWLVLIIFSLYSFNFSSHKDSFLVRAKTSLNLPWSLAFSGIISLSVAMKRFLHDFCRCMIFWGIVSRLLLVAEGVGFRLL